MCANSNTSFPSEDHTDYCWPLDLKCTAGEHLQQAFVLMPVDQYVVTHVDLTVNGHGPVEGTLNAHQGPTMLPDDCGLRYDVTSVYQSTPRESQGVGSDFCVQVFPRSQLEEKLSWLQAHLFCQKHGANLLSLSSQEEDHYILKLLHDDYGCDYL